MPYSRTKDGLVFLFVCFLHKKCDDKTDCSWHAWNSHQRLWKETGGIENQRKNRDHTDHSTVKIS